MNWPYSFRILKKLYNIRLLTPAGLLHLTGAVLAEGINLMTLLRLAAKLHGRNSAVADEKEEISYKDLYEQAQRLAAHLQTKYNLKPGQKAALICRNNTSLIKSVFAVSRLGADIYLLNPEMTAAQFAALNERHGFDFLIYDAEISGLIDNGHFKGRSVITYDENSPSIDNLAKTEPEAISKIEKAYSSNIIVLTGGTTGEPKTARRKASIFNFLNPFFALMVELNLDDYKSVYIATPAYHGFGIAAVFIGLILGHKMFFLARFDAQKGGALIELHRIEAVTLVPLMLQRMINRCGPRALASLACIISGGAPLNPALVEETFEKLGDKLFNLYGTSEAGFSVMATPADLRYSSNTIGKKIIGVDLKILDAGNNEAADGAIGRLCIKSRWAIKNTAEDWVETGDLGYRDDAGYYFLCGRIDEMIVSGGENVYPVELENILVKHPEIRQVAAVGVPDFEFGQRLKAFVVPADGCVLDQAEILDWLSTRVARFQMPASIVFLEELPVTSVGKINKKILS